MGMGRQPARYIHRIRSVVCQVDHWLRHESSRLKPAKLAKPDVENTREVSDDFFHQILHELRTLELERLHMEGGRVLSIGASGRWYFDWFERSVGRVDEHIGVEAFENAPDDLPAYVRWNPSTADHFEGIDNESVEMVFAGQTTEHLWATELTDFLLESHRVLRPGAPLVLDSPNRLVTEHLCWTHGGHTVELSADEITALLVLAGFEIERRTGLLVTRIDGTVMQLQDGLDRGDIVVRRLRSGPEFLDDGFIWWIVARRTGATPDRSKLLAEIENLFWLHWPTRICRGMWDGPTPGMIVVPRDSIGPIATTLAFPIAAGNWTLGIEVDAELDSVADDLEVRILDITGDPIHILTTAEASRSDGQLSWGFFQPHLRFDCFVQLIACNPVEEFSIRMPFELRSTTGIGVRATA